MLTGGPYYHSAHALANSLCLEAASIRFQLHAEVSFGLFIFLCHFFLMLTTYGNTAVWLMSV